MRGLSVLCASVVSLLAVFSQLPLVYGAVLCVEWVWLQVHRERNLQGPQSLFAE